MKKGVIILWTFLVISALGMIAWAVTHINANNKDSTVSLEPLVANLQEEADQLFSEYLPLDFKTENAERAMSLTKKRWYLYARSDDKTVYWNSNKVNLDSAIENNTEYPVYFSYGDDSYVVFDNGNDAYLAFRIANEGKLHSRVIQAFPELSNKKLVDQNQLQLKPPNTPLTFITVNRESGLYWWFQLALCIAGIFLILYYFSKDSFVFIWISLGLAIANIISYYYLGTSFKDFYFLTIESFQNISDKELTLRLFIHILGASSITLTLIFLLGKLPSLLGSIGQFTLLFFSLDFIYSLIIALAEHSSISYDFEKLFKLSFYSIFSIALLGLSLFILWFLVHYIFSKKRTIKEIGIGIVVAILIFCSVQIWEGNRTISDLWQPILLLGLSILISLGIKENRAKIYAHFIYSALFISILIFTGHKNREKTFLQSFAENIISNSDPRAESILKGIENQLSQEFLTPEDYRNFIFKKDVIESRIKNLYFSNYLEKYELKLLSFGPSGENINENTLYSFEDLNKVFNTQTKRTASDYFYQIASPSSFNGYIAKYENCDIDGHFGSTFIILQPRLVQSEFLYPEVFANQKSKELITVDDYSYGIYYNNKLVSQRGSYDYRLDKQPENLSSSWLSFGAFHHVSFTSDAYDVILSKPENRLKSWLSAFTFSVIILIVLSLFLSLLSYNLLSPQHSLSLAFLPGSSRFLSARIQTSLTIILLLGLLFSVYIIINYIRSGYNENLESQLLTKVKSISTRLQNKIDLDKKLQDPEQRMLMLNEESSTYKVDINLFNNDGKLLASTKPYLTSEQVLGDHMNPKVYLELTRQQSSQLLVQEELEGSDYLSAYVPLFDGKNRVIGYLNTPFFAKNELLNKQISNLVVNILNIYFLLLLGGILMAYFISRQISKPLLLIREKIAKTELRAKNELIKYNRDDEIGQLVKQYNKMVLELEESASQMAQSEREGAWREMAKQVAHEIKNPLTPMKLSIQHLQRAYQGGPSEKLDALFTKTSELLIDQINSLSNMAGQFSNFAQMPVGEKTNFDLSQVLINSIDLFKRSENTDIISEIEDNITITGDPEQIQRVFNNLIKNAIQAIPYQRKGRITIDLKSKDQTALIEIKDNGKGIPPELSKKVFVPNFSTKNSGMGLGLAISKKIVENAGGVIYFESNPDIGTTFFVDLPQI